MYTADVIYKKDSNSFCIWNYNSASCSCQFYCQYI